MNYVFQDFLQIYLLIGNKNPSDNDIDALQIKVIAQQCMIWTIII